MKMAYLSSLCEPHSVTPTKNSCHLFTWNISSTGFYIVASFLKRYMTFSESVAWSSFSTKTQSRTILGLKEQFRLILCSIFSLSFRNNAWHDTCLFCIIPSITSPAFKGEKIRCYRLTKMYNRGSCSTWRII